MLKYEIASASVTGKVSLARTSLVGRQNATCYGAPGAKTPWLRVSPFRHYGQVLHCTRARLTTRG